MNEEPLEAQSVEHWTFEQLLARSLEEWKKRLGLPSKIVEADQSADSSKLIQDTKEGDEHGC